MARKRKYSRRARAFVARKIRTLAHEGMPAPRRVAAALSMARAQGLQVPRQPNGPIVPEEGPQEHLRNALAIIQAHFEVGEKDAMAADDLRAVGRRIQTALRQLDDPRVNTTLPRAAGHRRIQRRKNPALAILGNPRVEDATVATWAKIEYIRPDDPDGTRVIRVHEFKDGFEIGWLSDGSVQLSHPQHPLWMEDEA